MNEHPILFSTPMVKSILEGRKTQTRRVIKPQREKFRIGFQPNTWFYGAGDDGVIDVDGVIGCPYGQPGDHLWIRETWQRCPECGRVVYQASSNQNGKVCPNCDEWLGPWKPSIHMFREYSRLTLEVVRVRVERLHEISEEDIRAEGTPTPNPPPNKWMDDSKWRATFSNLWDSINEKRGFGWGRNPWVWVVEFKRLH